MKMAVALGLVLLLCGCAPQYQGPQFRPAARSVTEMKNLEPGMMAMACRTWRLGNRSGRVCVGVRDVSKPSRVNAMATDGSAGILVDCLVSVENLGNGVEWISLSSAKLEVGGSVVPVSNEYSGWLPSVVDVYPGTKGKTSIGFLATEKSILEASSIRFLCQYHGEVMEFEFRPWRRE